MTSRPACWPIGPQVQACSPPPRSTAEQFVTSPSARARKGPASSPCHVLGLIAIDPERAQRPAAWTKLPIGGVALSGQGLLERSVEVPAGGPYRVWLKGDFSRAVRVSIDGRPIGEAAYESGNEGNSAAPLSVTLAPGRHKITLQRGGGSVRPGDNAPGRLAAIILEPESAEQPAIDAVEPTQWRALCGRPLDWVAAVRR